METLKLLEGFASLYQGKVFIRENKFIKVITEDFLLEYNYGHRDEPSHFIYITHLDLGPLNFSIETKVSSFYSMVSLGHIKEIENFTVRSSLDSMNQTKFFILDLFKDKEFTQTLQSKLNYWVIEYANQTLTLTLSKPLKEIRKGNLSMEQLLHAYDLILLFKQKERC